MARHLALAVAAIASAIACGTLSSSGDAPGDADAAPADATAGDALGGGDGGSDGDACPGSLADPKNCGRCGLVCDSAVCANGRCAPQPVVSIDAAGNAPAKLTYATNGLFWLDRFGGATWACELPCGTPSMLTGSNGGGNAIAATTDDVFWTEGSGNIIGARVHVYRRATKNVDVGVGSDPWLALAYSPRGIIADASGYTVADNGLALTGEDAGVAQFDRTSKLLHGVPATRPTWLAPFAGGAWVVLDGTTSTLVALDLTTGTQTYSAALGPSPVHDIASTPDRVFVLSDDGAFRVTCAGIGCTIKSLAAPKVESIAADASGFYWLDGVRLMWIEDPGVPSTPVVLADGLGNARGLALSPTHVYFGTVAAILSVPKPK